MSRKQVFLSRLFSSVVLWSLALWTIFSGYEPGFFVLVSGLGLLGLWEFYTMLEVAKRPTFKIIGMLGGALIFVGGFYYLSQAGHPTGAADLPKFTYDFEVGVIVTLLLVVFARQIFQKTRDLSPIDTMAYTLFGILYVPWLFSFLTKIVYLPPRPEGHVSGQWFVLYLCVVTKFSDMGAYVTGSLIGRTKLIPHISPNKTWEGFFGALAFSVGGSFALRALLPGNPGGLGALSQLDTLILGLGLGFAAVIGDLAESIVKRSAGAKDSGRLLPGIGGALDLIDSILFTAPLLFFYLRFVVGMR
jgi:phosphatidate cytidylyltransferase